MGCAGIPGAIKGPSGAFASRDAGKQPCEELTASAGRPLEASPVTRLFPEFPPGWKLPALPRTFSWDQLRASLWAGSSGSPVPSPLGWGAEKGEEETQGWLRKTGAGR